MRKCYSEVKLKTKLNNVVIFLTGYYFELHKMSTTGIKK